MAMTLHWVSTPCAQREQAEFGNEPGWMDAMRGAALERLAHDLLRKRAFYRRIDPAKDDFSTPVYHQWSIGVECDMDELKARDAQMEEARLKGRAEAAALCIEAATRYRNQNGDGMCKWVIASALEDAAKSIQTP